MGGSSVEYQSRIPGQLLETENWSMRVARMRHAMSEGRRLIEAGSGRRLPSVVYTVRDYQPWGPETLRYSLRSLENVPHGRVFIVGHRPDWLSSHAFHIPTQQLRTPSEDGDAKFVNIGINLQAALEDARITEQFYWFNDDMFIMNPIEAIPMYARPYATDEFCERLKLSVDPEHNAFVWGCWTQRDMLRKMGYDTSTLNFTDCHYPMPLYKTETQLILDWMRNEYPKHPLGHFRAVVGSRYISERTRDCKIQDDSTLIPEDWNFASVYSVSWNGIAGRQIRGNFPTMSKYETYDG